MPAAGAGGFDVAVDSLSVAELLDRRAELLAGRAAPGRAADRADEGHAARVELDALRGELATRLSEHPPVVRRVTLDDPDELLDQLVATEPVHPVRSPQDAADRLDDDRRCFVLAHPELPDRPLNVVWCALVDDAARLAGDAAPAGGRLDDLGSILDPTAPTGDPRGADTAVFYSIWTAEPGSVGLPGGRTLLEGAVSTLRSELVGLSTFLTLSPVPGLRDSLEGRSDRAEWGGEAVEPTAVERAAVEFLTTLDEHGRPIDPVARFHLGNGARLLAVHADADRSDAGRRRSWGLMANYRYEPEDRAANRRALADGQVAVGPDLAR